MTRRTLIATTLALLLAGGSCAIAQTSAPATPAAAPAPRSGMQAPMQRHAGHDMMWDGMRHAGMHDGVIGDLHQLERLYLLSGRRKEMAGVYQDVLAKSQDPRVRNYVYRALARLQAQPANVDQAIATLRKGLDENLANEAKMREQRAAMRAGWQQRQGMPAASPAGK